ncbi:hypothetical protein [Methylobacterium sp. CM6257]
MHREPFGRRARNGPDARSGLVQLARPVLQVGVFDLRVIRVGNRQEPAPAPQEVRGSARRPEIRDGMLDSLAERKAGPGWW